MLLEALLPYVEVLLGSQPLAQYRGPALLQYTLQSTDPNSGSPGFGGDSQSFRSHFYDLSRSLPFVLTQQCVLKDVSFLLLIFYSALKCFNLVVVRGFSLPHLPEQSPSQSFLVTDCEVKERNTCRQSVNPVFGEKKVKKQSC